MESSGLRGTFASNWSRFVHAAVSINLSKRSYQRCSVGCSYKAMLVWHDKIKLSMYSSWIRAFSLVAVAALFANAQCSNTCAITARDSAQTPSNDCHHHKSSHEDGSGCQHHHSEFTGPESGIVKVSVAPVVPILAVLTAGAEVVLIEPLLLLSPESASPPGGQISSAISVLRI